MGSRKPKLPTLLCRYGGTADTLVLGTSASCVRVQISLSTFSRSHSEEVITLPCHGSITGSNPATIFIGLIAQLAEQRFEDPRVSSSIPFQTIYTDMVERHTHWT